MRWRTPVIALTVAVGLPGCGYLWDESETLVDLYNPQTREHARRGLPMHRGSPSEIELADRDACVAVLDRASTPSPSSA